MARTRGVKFVRLVILQASYLECLGMHCKWMCNIEAAAEQFDHPERVILRGRRWSVRFSAPCIALYSAILALATFFSGAVIADDPCESPDIHATGVADAFQRAGRGNRENGVFVVKKIGDYGEGPTGRPHFIVEYKTADTVVFRSKILHPNVNVSDTFTLRPLQVDGGASLGIRYESGAGGAIACTYVLKLIDGRFSVKRGLWPLSQRDRLISEIVKAAERGDLKAVMSAIRAGADVDGRLPDDEENALYYASQNGHLAVVKALLDHGARVDGTGGDSLTPLMAAANAGHTKIVQELLQRGGDPHIRIHGGTNAISLAESSGQVAIVKLLKGEANSAASLPPLPYLDFGYQVDVVEGRWTLRKSHKLLKTISREPIVLGTLPAGTKVEATKIGVLTISYTVARARKPLDFEIWNWNYRTSKYDERRVSLKRGEAVAVLSYFGEGECRVWVRGSVYIAFCPDDSDEGPFLSDPAYQELRTEIWAAVVTSDGRHGFLRDPDAAGMSKHE